MSIILIVGWILFIILTGIATYFGAIVQSSKEGSEHDTISSWHLLLIWAAAIISKILLIENIWLAIGVWLVIGFGLGYLTERILWARVPPSKRKELIEEERCRKEAEKKAEMAKLAKSIAQRGREMGLPVDPVIARAAGEKAPGPSRAIQERREEVKKGGVLIGCGFAPTQALIQDAINRGDLKNCTTVTCMSAPPDADVKKMALVHLGVNGNLV